MALPRNQSTSLVLNVTMTTIGGHLPATRTPHREATLTKGRKVGGRRRAEKKTPHGGEIITREAKASGNLGWIGTTTGMTVLMFETEGEHQHCHLQQPGYLLFLFFHGFSVYSFVLTGSPPFRVIFLGRNGGLCGHRIPHTPNLSSAKFSVHFDF